MEDIWQMLAGLRGGPGALQRAMLPKVLQGQMGLGPTMPGASSGLGALGAAPRGFGPTAAGSATGLGSLGKKGKDGAAGGMSPGVSAGMGALPMLAGAAGAGPTSSGALSGAMTGIQAGSALGPPGMIIGGLLGAGLGGGAGGKQGAQEEDARRRALAGTIPISPMISADQYYGG